MDAIGEAVEAIKDFLPTKDGDTTEQMLKEALQDETIKEFISENNVSKDTILTYRSVLIGFHRRTLAGEELQLGYSDGYRHEILEIRETPPKVKRRKRILVLDSVTESMRGVRFTDLARDPFNDKLINSLERLVADYNETKDKPGIWVHGEFGRGKSYILGALANELHAIGVGVTFLSARTFVNEYINASFERETYLERVSTQEVVILDDMGTERLSDKGFEGLYAMLASRQANGLLTFASSNLTVKEYVQTIEKAQSLDAQRLETRLVNLFHQFNLSGENKRRR